VSFSSGGNDFLNNLGKIEPTKKDGSEKFVSSGDSLGFDLLNFWQWSSSDLLSNATRGILAEFLVGKALNAVDGVRDEWGAFDLHTPEGIKVEVKASGYLQSWHQNRLSPITFGVAKTKKWNVETGKYSPKAYREADVYVFALFAHQDKKSANPLDLSQWKFFVLPTVVLDDRERSQHSISLASLKSLTNATLTYSQLREAVLTAADENKKQNVKIADVVKGLER
jgi:hypothetical protein